MSTETAPLAAVRVEPVVRCPFCGDGDFDLIGLKLHIDRGWCQRFEDIETTDRYLHGRLTRPDWMAPNATVEPPA